MAKGNKTGKGGFKDNPQNIGNGRPKGKPITEFVRLLGREPINGYESRNLALARRMWAAVLDGDTIDQKILTELINRSDGKVQDQVAVTLDILQHYPRAGEEEETAESYKLSADET